MLEELKTQALNLCLDVNLFFSLFFLIIYYNCRLLFFYCFVMVFLFY